MPGRKVASEGYRYGFNGKENDADLGTQDYGMRIYNPALGKFLSVDPLTQKYSFFTPYQFAGNTPIQATDLDGGEALFHTTSSPAAAVSINRYGFNGSTFGKYSSYNWFSKTPVDLGAGTSVAQSGGPILQVEGLDRTKVDLISKTQMEAWKLEAMKDMGYKSAKDYYKALNELVDNSARQNMSSQMWGRAYSKLGAYMDAMKQPGYYLEHNETYAFSDAVVNSKEVRITKMEGPGTSTAMKFMQREGLSGEAAAALKEYGKAGTMMKWGSRLCVGIAVAADVYEIYQSDNRTRTIAVKAAGWAGGLGMGAWAGAAGAGTGPAAILTGLVGFGIGYFVGSETTKILYDYYFSKVSALNNLLKRKYDIPANL